MIPNDNAVKVFKLENDGQKDIEELFNWAAKTNGEWKFLTYIKDSFDNVYLVFNRSIVYGPEVVSDAKAIFTTPVME